MIDKVCTICPNIGIVYSGMGPDYRVSLAQRYCLTRTASLFQSGVGSVLWIGVLTRWAFPRFWCRKRGRARKLTGRYTENILLRVC